MKTKWTIGFIAAVYFTAYLYFAFWKGAFNGGDTWGYYIHLPSIFLFQDAGDYSQSSAAWRQHNPTRKDPREELHVSPSGKRVVKYPVGVALMEAPFFAAAHIYCALTWAVRQG